MLDPKWDICITPPPPKVRATLWKRRYKDCKIQRSGMSGMTPCLMGITEMLHSGTLCSTGYLYKTWTKSSLSIVQQGQRGALEAPALVESYWLLTGEEKSIFFSGVWPLVGFLCSTGESYSCEHIDISNWTLWNIKKGRRYDVGRGMLGRYKRSWRGQWGWFNQNAS